MAHRSRLTRLGGTLGSAIAIAAFLGAAPLAWAALAAPATATYRSGDLRVALPAGDAAEAVISVPDAGRVTGLKAGVRLDHPRPGDLEVTLAGPAGDEVILSLQNGRGGRHYGGGAAGCGGTLAVFDDGAGTPVEGAAAPFLGAFRPEEPLAKLAGTEAEGDWTLRIVDDGEGAGGTLYCWQLELARDAAGDGR
jgi:subtilisin-like proprotein convertase family protein